MAKISSYTTDSAVSLSDMLIGTDVENDNQTKNFTVGDVANAIATAITPGILDQVVAVNGPYLSAYSEVQQVVSFINYSTQVIFEFTDFSKDISIEPNGVLLSRITPVESGVYNIQFTAQLQRTTGGSSGVVDVWLRKGEVDIPGSTKSVNVHGSDGYAIVSMDFMLPIDVNDADPFVEVMWSTTDINITLQAQAVTGVHPSAASASVSVTRVANI